MLERVFSWYKFSISAKVIYENSGTSFQIGILPFHS